VTDITGPVEALCFFHRFQEAEVPVGAVASVAVALVAVAAEVSVVVEQEEAGDEETHNRSWSYGQWKNYVCSSSRLTARRRNYQC
jgi:hypothetical protein